MVWIHGGSNNVGAGSQPDYDGGNLAKKNVVVVTINYRLDVFGFLAIRSRQESRDEHIRQLRTVGSNCSPTMGAEEHFRVWGRSQPGDGVWRVGWCVRHQPADDFTLAKGLFARAIGESGGALTPIPAFGPKPLRIGEEDGAKFAQALGASSIAELRGKPAQEILQAAFKAPITYGFGVVDGYVVPDIQQKHSRKASSTTFPCWSAGMPMRELCSPHASSSGDRRRPMRTASVHNSRTRQTRC